MKENFFKLSLILIILASFALPVSVALAIDAPDVTFQISVVDVYGGTSGILSANDQLYIIYYTVDYTTTPSQPINQTFLARLVNGSNDYAQAQPYPYFSNGYNQGIISIYLSSGAPAWGGPHTIRLEGNPALSWSGSTPLTTWTLTSDNWTLGASTLANKLNIENRIKVVAQSLEYAWNVDLIADYADGSKRLTTNGVDYFTNAIPNLYSMAPGVFPTGITVPTVVTRSYTQSMADTTEGRLSGTSIDNYFNQRPFGLSPLLAKIIVLFLIIGCIAWGVTITTGETKPAIFVSIPAFLAGIWLGFGPLVFAALIAMFIMLGVAYVLLFRTSS